MKKIIAAFDGLNFSSSTLEFATDLTKKCSGYLVGVFLDDLVYHSYRFADVINSEGAVTDARIDYLNQKDEDLRKSAIEAFTQHCEKNRLNFTIHRDRSIAVRELLQESIYADLVIMNRNDDFNIYRNDMPSGFLTDILSDIQCPILLVPNSYYKPTTNIILYDGKPASVYAVKMFSNFYEGFLPIAVEVVCVKSKKSSFHLPDNTLMKEFLKRHFPAIKYTVLHGEAEEEILKYISHKGNELMLTLGANQRGRISRWLKHSLADTLMSNFDFPLFIAHK